VATVAVKRAQLSSVVLVVLVVVTAAGCHRLMQRTCRQHTNWSSSRC